MATILIIDDDQHVRDGLQAVLVSEGHIVMQADSARAGQAHLEQYDGQTDLILLDVWLGEENGLTLLGEIRTDGFEGPVIVMSGGGPGRTLEQAMAIADVRGANQVLIKPFTNDEILDAVQSVLKTD